MKSESIILFQEQFFEYKGWRIHIRKKFSFLSNKFHIFISKPQLQSGEEAESMNIQKTIKTKIKWIDLLGNNRRMLDECFEEVKKYIDTALEEGIRE